MEKRGAKFELERALLADAAEIIAARAKSFIIHHSHDIGAAGDEVEITARRVLSRRLPSFCAAKHGHVVDDSLETSPQLDIIVANQLDIPRLFETLNGTEYVPFESVYAIGEVKSSYQKSRGYIEAFSSTIRQMRHNLNRKKTQFRGPQGASTLTSLEAMKTGNPLFSFMLFASSRGFKTDDILDFYQTTQIDDLPNIVCFLDRGVIVNANVVNYGTGGPLVLNEIPAFNREGLGIVNSWVLVTSPDTNLIQAFSWGMLYFMLIAHINKCEPAMPDWQKYLASILGNSQATVFDLLPGSYRKLIEIDEQDG